MKRNSLALFWIITLLIFGIPLLGKQHFPQYLGGPWVQLGFAIVTAIACPIGALFALRLMLAGDRWGGYGLFLCFCGPVVVTLTAEGAAAPILGRTYAMLKPGRNEFGAIARMSEFCLTPEIAPEKRAERAAFAYTTWGIKLAVLHKNNSFTLFVPDSAQEKSLEQTVQSWRLGDQTENMLDDQLRQMPWIFGLYLGSFCGVMALGLGWFACRGVRVVAG